MPKIMYCPFFKTNMLEKKGACRLSCEHGTLIFYSKQNVNDFLEKYCGEQSGWKDCSLAGSLMEYYEEIE